MALSGVESEVRITQTLRGIKEAAKEAIYRTDEQLATKAYDVFVQLRREDGVGIKTATNGGFFDNCGHGRDTAIMSYDATGIYELTENTLMRDMARSGLTFLFQSQAIEYNPFNGAQTGKAVHEIRWKDYEFLIDDSIHKPWYHEPNVGVINYDSVDSTALMLIAAAKYLQVSRDKGDQDNVAFIFKHGENIQAGLAWIMQNALAGSQDLQYLPKFWYPKEEERERYGGLSVQNWTDSNESLSGVNGQMPQDPISNIEPAAFAWKALMEWGFELDDTILVGFADEMKRVFNDKFILKDKGLYYGAQALDGNGNQIRTITGNPIMCAWASLRNPHTQEVESIIDRKYWSDFVERSQMSDLMSKEIGLRTMSTESPTYIKGNRSYHNGAAWGMQNGKTHEGLLLWGYPHNADRLFDTWMNAFRDGKISPTTELVNEDEETLVGFENPDFHAQRECDGQGWSASGVLHAVTVRNAHSHRFSENALKTIHLNH